MSSFRATAIPRNTPFDTTWSNKTPVILSGPNTLPHRQICNKVRTLIGKIAYIFNTIRFLLQYQARLIGHFAIYSNGIVQSNAKKMMLEFLRFYKTLHGTSQFNSLYNEVHLIRGPYGKFDGLISFS